MQYPVICSEPVRAALDAGQPVVALESTVIAHGLPWPHNLEVALDMEVTITAGGVTPATVAVVDGELRAGLDRPTLERLAKHEEPVAKLTRRDLGIALASGGLGATTVASTMFIAHRAGIRVFATGGIGGVHRGDAGDVSADLPELARTPVVVVCSGAKSILDLPRTVEWFETFGVPVLGYQTNELPAFFVRSSGLPVQRRVDSAADAAQLIEAHWALGLASGVLVTVPAPEAHAADPAGTAAAIDRAVAAAEAAGIRGKELTPYVIGKVAELTGGASVKANLALLKHNAAVAAQIAAALG
ncbi:MAG: pseudouridine-5'-phosphate glycosidase [Anaerolineae bacterium]|nr:pseudouridine-5'-phosphate glycosidase [Anaerolineae bacterium]